MATTITLAGTIAAVQPGIKYRPLAFPSLTPPIYEPAVTMANKILLAVLGPPFGWRWNRLGQVTVTCIPEQTDYPIPNLSNFGWIETAQVQDISANARVQNQWKQISRVECLAMASEQGLPHSIAAQYDTTSTINTTAASVVGTTGVPIQVVVPTIAGMAQNAFVSVDTGANQEMVQITGLNPALPAFTAVYTKLHLSTGFPIQGVLTFRIMPAPDQAYPIALDIQQKPTLFSNTASAPLSQLWSPIPDEYSHLYTWGFEALALLLADDPRFGGVNQKFVSALLTTHQGLSENDKNIFLTAWQAVTGAPILLLDKLQQGVQTRAV
jgi:hypothetical protein